ncbi:MAG: 23S rRNA (adenine(2503)-C(2))-methyltransferase RlmN [Proteobacteria bacterium]|nr:23S rRNA (adenine(2503)-C(2))-methyltransferase RlmN [Pseudomonadota bacterium]MDA0951448.1 23S rRNA (adenine(2503)-C(2))-methyltransferase RlmN [Pseudomonadota bacterium]
MDSALPPDTAKNLIGLSREQLAEEMAAIGEKPFRVKQIWHWLYHRGVTDIAEMSTLSKAMREKLAQGYYVGRPQVARHQVSEDGTQKWLLRLEGGHLVESVHIPEEDRGALCISSQVGCTLTCTFCHTGTQRLVRNLDPGEIVGQFMLARDYLGEWPTPSGGGRLLSNIVMMGMGEPLYNFENVKAALRIVIDEEGISLSRRRITLSTSGVVPMMARCGEELNVDLAVSLHAVSDEIRDKLVPLNKKYPIEELLAACRAYPGASNARRITFEYVMLKDINDSDADARELVRILKGIPAKVNLIPFNPWPGAIYECSSNNRIHAFSRIVNDGGLSAPVRRPRGRDIAAACGQLKSETVKLRKSELLKQQAAEAIA